MYIIYLDVVGRGIQRPSFFPFRYSRQTNEPIVVNYPDPDTHLPNYPIKTPYTFSSTTSIASQNNAQQLSPTGAKLNSDAGNTSNFLIYVN